MKHNQFKKLIRKHIEELCKTLNWYCLYVDVSNKDRVFYIYNQLDASMGTMSVYTTDKEFYMKYSSNTETTVNLANCVDRWQGSYTKLRQAKDFIDEAIDYLKSVNDSESEITFASF